MSFRAVAITIACEVSKYRCASWSRIWAMAPHGMSGSGAVTDGSRSLTASPISTRRMRIASNTMPSSSVRVA